MRSTGRPLGRVADLRRDAMGRRDYSGKGGFMTRMVRGAGMPFVDGKSIVVSI